MNTIRTRITLAATLAVVAVLVATAVGLLSSQRRMLTDRLDDSLVARAESVAASVRQPGLASPLPPGGDDDSFAVVVAADGALLASTDDPRDEAALAATLRDGSAMPQVGELDIDTAHPIAGEPAYRVVSLAVEVPAPAGLAPANETTVAMVFVGEPLDDIDESLAALRTGLATAIPAVAAVLALLVWLLVGRTLRPVESIRREVSVITGTDLARRVPEPGTGDEIDRLAHTMNAMLERIEQVHLRQQQFVADASHELRSPLARMRSELEVDLAHPATADPLATHHSVLDDIDVLQQLVDDLLMLATGPTVGGPPSTVVDLDDIVMEQVRHCRATFGGTVDVGAVSAAQVRGDAGQLAQVVRNLLDNAARHARSRIVVTVSSDDTGTRLTVTDDGEGIAPADRERVFERFTRLDDSRTRSDGGVGLGLAICRAVVERHGGTVDVDPAHAGGARLVVDLPVR